MEQSMNGLALKYVGIVRAMSRPEIGLHCFDKYN